MSLPPTLAITTHDGIASITLTGRWTRSANLPSAAEVLEGLDACQRVDLRACDVDDWDSSLVNFALQLHRAAERDGVTVDTDLPSGATVLLRLARSVAPAQLPTKKQRGFFQGLVDNLNPIHVSTRLGNELAALFEFIGGLLTGAARAATGQARVRLSDAFRFGYQTGPNALPIISLTSLLVGMILGYLGAVQLQQFGAGLYVANLVTIGVLREMGALMTAIIIAGRTGAAYAAQLGTMRVNEEIDAIEILGVSPMEFLVLPRVLAVILMMPLLTLYADVLGILGGGIVAGGLGITPLQYWTQTQTSLGLDHLLVGLVKSVLFGALIGIAGCRAGLSSGRNSEGVGKATTTAVVVALIYLIVADALINVICQLLEI